MIGGGDLLTRAQSISGVTYRTIEMLLVASFWYFVVVAVLTVLQHGLTWSYAWAALASIVTSTTLLGLRHWRIIR